MIVPFAGRALFTVALLFMALTACGTLEADSSKAPAKVPASLDTGTPARSNIALRP